MRCKVICNPKSGRHTAPKKLERIVGKLVMENGISVVDVCYTAAAGDARRAAAAARVGEYDFIIGAGGDGTFNEIANGLMDSGSGLPLAMLPGGTINDLAYHLNLPTEPEEFCRMINHGSLRELDLGCANGRYFVSAAAFGMFADIGYKTGNRDKSVLGKLAYYLRGMLDLPEQLFSSIQLETCCGGETITSEALVCIIANSPSVGGARNLISKAKVDDGLFDLFLLRKPDTATISETFQKLLNGEGLGLGMIQQRQISEATFRTLDGKQVELDLDGENCGVLPLTVKVAPKALKLFVPDFPAQWSIKGGRGLFLAEAGNRKTNK